MRGYESRRERHFGTNWPFQNMPFFALEAITIVQRAGIGLTSARKPIQLLEASSGAGSAFYRDSEKRSSKLAPPTVRTTLVSSA
jgi:hypothetical protein